jgi:NAD(P)H-dependent flavin oxidoreductase YrpB (nitropropane dioxygenase family)
MKTRITELLGIKYPIMQGAMQWIANAEFAAEVSNAGGLGTINATIFSSPEAFRSEIRKMKDLTGEPFAVNISMLPETSKNDLTEAYFTIAFEEKMKIIETAGRSPEKYMDQIKKNKIILIHKVPALRYALKAQAIGADVVTIVGFECGGHPGMDDVANSVLVPRVCESLHIPVLAAGGVDGRSLVAALAWGAAGLVMGTRFLATQECPVHQNFKDWIVQASERDTVLIEKNIRNPLRAIKNEAVQKILAMEAQGAGLAELLPLISGSLGRKAIATGDLGGAAFTVGQSVGLIHEIKSVREVVEGTVKEAAEILRKLNQGLGM